MGIGLYVFYINFCVERFEVSDNRRHTIYGSTLNDFSTIFFFFSLLVAAGAFHFASSVRTVSSLPRIVIVAGVVIAILLLLRFFWFSFYQRQGKKDSLRNRRRTATMAMAVLTAIVVTLVDFYDCMSAKKREFQQQQQQQIIQFIVSNRTDTFWARLPMVFWCWCAIFHIFFFFFSSLLFNFYASLFPSHSLSLSIIIMIFEVSTAMQKRYILVCELSVRNAKLCFGGRGFMWKRSTINILYMERACGAQGGRPTEWSSERIFRYVNWWMCALPVYVAHVLSSEQIDMDGENKLENKINIVYYVHWALLAEREKQQQKR